MSSPLFCLAGGHWPAALLRNRGRLRALLGRQLARELLKKHTALLAGRYAPRLARVVSPYAISLTSWRPRLATLPLTLLTLIEQSVRPAGIYVWLAATDIQLLDRQVWTVYEACGVRFRTADDLGPHKKWLPMLEVGMPEPFVICDDDIIYPRGWFAALVAEDRTDAYVGCKCHRMVRGEGDTVGKYADWSRQIGWDGRPARDVFITGCGGAIIHPPRIPGEFRDRRLLLAMCPRADDVWLKLAHHRAGLPCYKIRYSFPCLDIPGTDATGLAVDNVEAGGNDRQMAACLRHFDVAAASFFR